MDWIVEKSVFIYKTKRLTIIKPPYKMVTKFATCFSQQLYLVKVSKLPLCFPTHTGQYAFNYSLKWRIEVRDDAVIFYSFCAWRALVLFMPKARIFELFICSNLSRHSFDAKCGFYITINSFKLKFRISMDILYDS